ncbi:MAG: hypothetical protein ABI408_02310 [Gemmatimonadaceae bacterium]
MKDQKNSPSTDIPTDSGELAGDRAEIDRATPRRALDPDELESDGTPNPPHTTKGWFTAPKFGSASSGGGEIEPGPEKD